MLNYKLVDGKTLTVLVDGKLYTADKSHANWSAILDKVIDGDPSVVQLFEVTKTVSEKFRVLSDRVTLKGRTLYFDGDPVHGTLVDQIVKFVNEDEDFKPLVKFMENLANNPQKESREQLYRWITATGGFTITEDGFLIGYKGLDSDGNSIHAGYGIVDGVEYNGKLPNKDGSVITMPRSRVTFDPSNGCSFGLHVGTWEYANSFGRGYTAKVLVDPRDVVSVPTDCGDQKMRVCKYKVLERVQQKVDSLVDKGYSIYKKFDVDPDELDEDYDEEDYDYEHDFDEDDRVVGVGNGNTGTVVALVGPNKLTVLYDDDTVDVHRRGRKETWEYTSFRHEDDDEPVHKNKYGSTWAIRGF